MVQWLSICYALCLTSFTYFKSISPKKERESEVALSCPTLCNPHCSLLRSSIHGFFQARVLEWVAISFSRASSWLRDRTWVSCIVGRRFTIWATREVPKVAVISLIINWNWISLVVQWLSICVLMQGTRVPSLLQEDPMCCRTTKPVRHNGWVCALEPRSRCCWSLPALEPVLCSKRSLCSEKPPQQLEGGRCSPQLEKAHVQQRTPSVAKKNKEDRIEAWKF